jgi:glutamate/tyrosine decarboxylase-like PLP-dependent enzyme
MLAVHARTGGKLSGLPLHSAQHHFSPPYLRQAHSSVRKACMVAGIVHVRTLPTCAGSGWAMRATDLREALRCDRDAGLLPAFLCATVGTTSCGAVDPLRNLAEAALEYGVWTHVDAAWAGVTASGCTGCARGARNNVQV